MATISKMLRKIGRLFTIKTRLEAWFVIYAIALGAIERGRHYLDIYPGGAGWSLALACTGVVFLAGGKLLDSVRKPAIVPGIVAGPYRPAIERRPKARRNQPTARPLSRFSTSRISRRRD